MIKIRLFNFSYFSLFAIFLSFLPVYLSASGMPETEIGMMIGLGGIISILSQPVWGVVCDKRRTIKNVLLLILALSVGIGFWLFQSSVPLVLLLLIGLMYFLFMPTDPLVESLTYQSAQKFNISYGSIRMYGALGYATASFVIGNLTAHYGITSMAYLFLGYGLVTLFLCTRLDDVPASGRPVKFADLKSFIVQKNTLGFFVMVLIMAIPHRMNDTFVGIYIGKLGGNLQLVGFAWFMMTIVEVAFFAIVHRFLKPGNELKMITIAGLFYTLRFYLMSVTDNPYGIVALQLLQGVTFVFFYSSGIQYLYSIIPEEWKATGQTILAMIFFGFSGIIGSIVGGAVFDMFGGGVLYGMMALLSAAGTAICFAMRKRAAGADTGL